MSCDNIEYGINHIKDLIQNGESDVVKSLVTDKKIGLYDTDQYSYNAMIHACILGDLGLAKFLINNGYDVNVLVQGTSPLHQSAKYGNLGMVKFLLKHGADVNLLTDNKNTPLMYAVLFDNYDVVKLLVKNKANVNAQTIYGRTALMDTVIETKNIKMTKFLMENGAHHSGSLDVRLGQILDNNVSKVASKCCCSCAQSK